MAVLKLDNNFNKFLIQKSKSFSNLENIIYTDLLTFKLYKRVNKSSFIKINLLNEFSSLNMIPNWFLIKKAFTNKEVVTTRVLNVVDKGYLVGFLGAIGFIPYFQLSNVKVLKGSIIKVRILKLDPVQKSILLTKLI